MIPKNFQGFENIHVDILSTDSRCSRQMDQGTFQVRKQNYQKCLVQRLLVERYKRNSRHLPFSWIECSPSTLGSIKPKTNATLSGRLILQHTKVMLNARNWMTTSCLNNELLWINALKKPHIPLRVTDADKYISTSNFGSLGDFIKGLKKDIPLCLWR